MVLFADDNKELVDDILDELELDDIEGEAVYGVEEYLKLLENEENFKNFKFIVMDYNFEDRLNGIDLLQKTKEKHSNIFKEKEVVLFSGVANYIKSHETKFLIENNIEIISKNERDILIDKILKAF